MVQQEDIEIEMSFVSTLIEEGKKEGLLLEVVMAYGDYRAQGCSVENAVDMALYDWDIR